MTEEVDRLRQQLEEAKYAQGEAEKALKSSQGRFEELRLRLEESEKRAKESALSEREGRDGGEERVRELEISLDEQKELVRQLEERLKVEMSKIKEEGEEELKRVKAQMEAGQTAAMQEKEELTGQLEQLREAGQALCGVYEEKLAAVEAERSEMEELWRSSTQEIEKQRDALANQQNQTPLIPPASPSMSHSSPSAIAIDNEALRADADHLKGRLHSLEEQLAEARAALETEMESTQRRRQQGNDNEANFRKEIHTLKDNLGKPTFTLKRKMLTSKYIACSWKRKQDFCQDTRARGSTQRVSVDIRKGAA